MTAPDVLGLCATVLAADPTLATRVPGGWHHPPAPAGTRYPHGLIELVEPAAPEPELNDAVGYWRSLVWLRVVVEGNTRISARETRDAAVQRLIVGWADPGWRLMEVWPVGYPETSETDDNARRYQHVGVIVTLWLDAAA